MNLKRIPFIVPLLFSITMLGCNNDTTGDIAPEVTVEKLDLPPADYVSIEWLPNGKLFLSSELENRVNVHDRRKYYLFNDGLLEEVSLPIDPLCRWQEYVGPTNLPDGRLGLGKNCAGRWPDEPPGLDMAAYLMAYDFDEKVLEQIVSEHLAEGISGVFTWNPDMSRGVIDGGSLFGTLYWVTPTGSMPMSATVGSGSKSWSLEESFRAMQNRESNNFDTGIARTPAWSHDGNTIAFFASPDAVGRSGHSRATGSYNLYLMDPLKLQPEAILSELYFPFLLEWSPDDNWLLLAAEAGNRRTEGLWLFSPADGSLQFIAQDSFGGVTWSPDGQKIAAIKCIELCVGKNEILIFDVTELLQND